MLNEHTRSHRIIPHGEADKFSTYIVHTRCPIPSGQYDLSWLAWPKVLLQHRSWKGSSRPLIEICCRSQMVSSVSFVYYTHMVFLWYHFIFSWAGGIWKQFQYYVRGAVIYKLLFMFLDFRYFTPFSSVLVC